MIAQLCLITAVAWFEVAACEAEVSLRAGAATSNITPPLGEPIVGGWESPAAKHIHDELHARCLVLDDGKMRIAIVICDNVGIPREVYDEAKRLIEQETGIPAAHQLMAATHTHSATAARGTDVSAPGKDLPEYTRFLIRRIADGVRRAVNNLESVRIGWGSAQAPEHVFNRRYHMKPGATLRNPFGGTDRVLMNPGVGNPNVVGPAGPTDPEVSFLSIQSLEGRPVALLANYSLHYVGGVPGQHVSGDYFGLFADRIAQLMGADKLDPPFVGIMTNGTSGDVNNIDVLGKAERLPPYEKMRRVADSLAQKVHHELADLPYREYVTLGMLEKELPVRTRRPTAELLDWARGVLDRPPDAKPAHTREIIYARRTQQMANAPESVPILLQTLRIGEVGIATIPFEVFTETGLDIKKRSPLRPTFTIELANGSYGYLPTAAQHELGGYETWLGTSRVEFDAASRITETLLDLLSELSREPSGRDSRKTVP